MTGWDGLRARKSLDARKQLSVVRPETRANPHAPSEIPAWDEMPEVLEPYRQGKWRLGSLPRAPTTASGG